jgi:hypothetical protein
MVAYYQQGVSFPGQFLCTAWWENATSGFELWLDRATISITVEYARPTIIQCCLIVPHGKPQTHRLCFYVEREYTIDVRN